MTLLALDAPPRFGWRGSVLVLPEPPSSNRYWRVWQGRAVRSREAEDYIAQVRTLAGLRDPLLIAVTVRIRWFRAKRMGDLDNRLKVTLDALRGVLYLDDRQVVHIDAWRYDRKPGWCEIEVAPATLGAAPTDGGR